MKKGIWVVLAVVVIAIIVVVAVMALGGKEEKPQNQVQGEQTGIKIQTAEDMQKLFNDINTKLQDALPRLEVREVDVTDELSVTAMTGLKSKNNVEAIVAAEPFMSSQAFSAVMVKVSDGANIEEMKKEMINNIDMRKWICVSAEKARVTNYGNIIFLVMSSEEWGKPVYDEFKQQVGGTVGVELERIGEE